VLAPWRLGKDVVKGVRDGRDDRRMLKDIERAEADLAELKQQVPDAPAIDPPKPEPKRRPKPAPPQVKVRTRRPIDHDAKSRAVKAERTQKALDNQGARDRRHRLKKLEWPRR